MTPRRYRTLYAAVALAVLSTLSACGGDDPFAPEVVEEVEFAASLGIDLSQMTKTASGMYFKDVVVGLGDPAGPGDAVVVGFTGWLADGTKFDSGEFPFTVGTGGVIAGFDEGVTGMRVDGARKIVLPPALAYGNTGSGPIPPGAVLVFQIDLRSIN
jgi:FKBP-type peptidyl-prolyl cis-trans isomerase FkpA